MGKTNEAIEEREYRSELVGTIGWMYLKEKKNPAQIAKELGFSESGVRNLIQRYHLNKDITIAEDGTVTIKDI